MMARFGNQQARPKIARYRGRAWLAENAGNRRCDGARVIGLVVGAEVSRSH
jgi:hypothetical protein